jgi:hypothetical protein
MKTPNTAVERMRASRLGQFGFLAQWRLARTAHRHRYAKLPNQSVRLG